MQVHSSGMVTLLTNDQIEAVHITSATLSTLPCTHPRGVYQPTNLPNDVHTSKLVCQASNAKNIDDGSDYMRI